MGTVVVDSSVLIAIRDPQDAHHDAASAAVAAHSTAGDTFVMPATVLAESLVAAARYKPDQVEQVGRLLAVMFGPTRVVDEEVAVEAARLRAKHSSLRLPDALVIATGTVDDADSILTADKRLSRIDKRVTVI